MKIFILFLVSLLLNACFLNKERRQWNSKKYPDDHFYCVLTAPKTQNTTALKMDRMYIYQADSLHYNHILFSKDQKIYSSPWAKGPVDESKIRSSQIHTGYFTTKNDTIIIEEISVIHFFTGNGRKGLPLVYRHFKTLAFVKNDSLFISQTRTVLKKSDWNKNPGYFYKPIVCTLY